MYGQPGSNRRSHACEACVLTTRRCPLHAKDEGLAEHRKGHRVSSLSAAGRPPISFSMLHSEQPWSSGMMEPSQGFDPGSIPGGCIFCSPVRHVGKSTPGGTRTHNLWLRKPTPYPLGYRGSAGVSGLVVEWLPATESARVRFPAHAFLFLQADVPKRLRGWTRNPLGSARAGSSPAVCDFPPQHRCPQKSTSRGARTHDHKVKGLALYRLS